MLLVDRALQGDGEIGPGLRLRGSRFDATSHIDYSAAGEETRPAAFFWLELQICGLQVFESHPVIPFQHSANPAILQSCNCP